MRKKYIIIFAGFLVALNFFAWKEVFALAGPHYLKVEFLNVGQGDSAFIQTPENHQILIDGGPNSTVLSKLAQNIPFWDKDLDLVILTHPESDHMQGLLDVLQKYKADYILWSGVTKKAAEYDKWVNVLVYQKSLGAKILIARAGQKIKAGNVSIDTIYPLESMEGRDMKNSSNDSCIVSKIVYGKNSFLFTGDIDTATEKKIVNSRENILADVLKVAHHGSKYSTSNLFLAAVAPRIANIEVGKNSYGHPTQEVLQRLADFGIKTLRTDQNGDITIISNGQKIQIQ